MIPAAKVVPTVTKIHGDTRTDNYFWLRDRSDPDVTAYLEAENSYTSEIMKPTEELQKQLYAELLGRVKEDDSSVPVKYGDWLYYTRTEKGKAYAIYCRKFRSAEAPEEIYLNANVLAEGHSYFRIGNITQSPDANLLAYSTDVEGDEAYTIRVKDLRTGALLPDEIHNTYYTLEWAKDNRTFFYTMLDEVKRPHRVYRHELGVASDTLVYQEDDPLFELDLGRPLSREYIFLNIDSPLTSEVRYIRSDQPSAEFAPILPREHGVEYDVDHQGEWFYIRTNQGAQNFRLLRTPIAETELTEVIAGRADCTIESMDAFRDYLVISERTRGLETIRIAHADSLDVLNTVEFPEPVYTVGLSGNAEYDTNIVRFAYSSLVTPASIIDYNMETGERQLRKQYEVLGYEPSLYQSERLFAQASDGVDVPISLVYRKGLERNGSNPMLLYGYGSYGAPTDPGFGSDRLSLLGRGYIYAIAHIRGGGDMGKFWHDDGKLLTKRNTFLDFIACAEHLIAQNYTAPGRLAIFGGSAGGLLVGAAVNMRPDLFHAAIAKVPFVDAVNTMLDPTIPLTIGEYEEWGNPEEEEFYRYILSYSPYDNVEPKRYPAMLVKAGLNDPRVAYWEPAKWVAKLRAMKTDNNVLLLKTNMGAGHFGPSGRYEGIKETAFEYAFLLTLS